MELLGLQDVSRIIKPYQEDLVFCVQNGFDDYFQKYGAFLHEHSTRSRTDLIYDRIASYAKNRFFGKDGVKIVDDLNETIFIVVQNQASIRFKKYRQNSQTANVRTGRINKYRGQEQMELIPDTVHLYCGYQPDPLFRKIDYILLTCPNYYGNRWELHLTNDEYMKSIVPMAAIDDNKDGILLPKLKIKTKTNEQNAA